MTTAASSPAETLRARTRGRRVPPKLVALLVFAAYVGLALHMTWPMPKDPDGLFYGGTGDPFGSAAVLREMAETGQPPFLPGTLHDFSNPDGLEIAWVRGLANLPLGAALYGLAVVFDEFVAYNVLAFTGMPLSAFAMFLLARRVTGNPWAATVAGFAFGFFPYATGKAHGHYELAHGWPLVLAVWRLLVLYERPSKRNGLWAGAALVFAMAWTPYFVLLGGIAYVAIALTALLLAARARSLRAHLVPHVLAAAMVVAYLGTFFVLSTEAAGEAQGLRENGPEQLNAYSARPWEFVVPHRGHRLVGDETGPWLEDHIHGSNFAESTLYLGLTVLLLALIAVVVALRRRIPAGTRAAVIMLAVAGLGAAWASAPPEGVVLGVTVPFPGKLITEVSSTWRVYARLVTIVMLAAALLAAVGLAALMRGRRPLVQAAVVVAAGAAVWVDLWPSGGGVNGIAAQPIHAVLAQQPRGTVAQYPLQLAGASFDAISDQRWHDQPLLNGYEPGSEEEGRALRLADPSNPDNVAALAALGVRYALVPPDPGTETLRFGRGFELIEKADSGARLFRLRPPARAARAVAVPIEGFGPQEGAPGGPFTWMEAPEGTIEVITTCRGCRGTLRMTLQSFAQPRSVTIAEEGGRVLWKGTVTTAHRRVAIPYTTRGIAQLTITASPGPIPVRSVVVGSADPRSVAVAVSALRFDDPARRRR